MVRLAGRRKRDELLNRVREGQREEPSAAREPAPKDPLAEQAVYLEAVYEVASLRSSSVRMMPTPMRLSPAMRPLEMGTV